MCGVVFSSIRGASLHSPPEVVRVVVACTAAQMSTAETEEGTSELAAPFMVPSFSAAVWIKEQRSRGADLAVCRRDLGRRHRALNEELSSLLQARGTRGS